MNFKKILFVLFLMQICMSVVITAYLVRLHIDIKIALRKIELTRIVASGRTEQDIIQQLGPPDSYEKDIFINNKSTYSLMSYRGKLFNSKNLIGNEDLNILLDRRGQVVTTYYESQNDVINLKRRVYIAR